MIVYWPFAYLKSYLNGTKDNYIFRASYSESYTKQKTRDMVSSDKEVARQIAFS